MHMTRCAGLRWRDPRLSGDSLARRYDGGRRRDRHARRRAGHELGELRTRALACGAVRAHVVDARDDFARDVLFPSLGTAPADETPRAISALAWPLIARKLVEIARIENAGAVAHGSTDPAFDAAIRGIDASIEIIAPARDWTMGDEDLASFVRARRLPVTTTSAPDCQIDQNLWGRIVMWTSPEAPTVIRTRASRHRLNESATIDLHFEHGMPTSVNGVPMSPAELVECLALIGGQHGIGQTVVSAQGRRCSTTHRRPLCCRSPRPSPGSKPPPTSASSSPMVSARF